MKPRSLLFIFADQLAAGSLQKLRQHLKCFP